MKDELESHGFKNPITVWGRGVDTSVFNEDGRNLSKLARYLYVGRISPEKNLEAYLDMPTFGMKYVVGDGPLLEYYKEKYKDDTKIRFEGPKKGKELQHYYANCEVFVFPSKTDTFGIVMLEAMACGTPVAAYPVTGPIDCVENNVTGILHENLAYATHLALLLNRDKIRKIGQTKTWESCTQIFRDSLVHK
jgi:glycosyltransferase involved in cell wall biosynthesis